MPETNFFWDPVEDNIIQERDETGAITAEYATEPYLYGNLISQNRGDVASQYHFDSQGSTLALTDDNQQVTDTYAYSAFGEVKERVGAKVNVFQFMGRHQSYSSQLTNNTSFRRNWVQPEQGRWLSRKDETLTSTSAYAFQASLSRHNNVITTGPMEPSAIRDSTFPYGVSVYSSTTVRDPNPTSVFPVGYGSESGVYPRLGENDLPWVYPHDSTEYGLRMMRILNIRIPIPEVRRRRLSLSHVCNADAFGMKEVPRECRAFKFKPESDGNCREGNGELVTLVTFDANTLRYKFEGQCIKCVPPKVDCDEGEKCVPCVNIGTELVRVARPDPGWYVVEKHTWSCKCIKFDKPEGCNAS